MQPSIPNVWRDAGGDRSLKTVLLIQNPAVKLIDLQCKRVCTRQSLKEDRVAYANRQSRHRPLRRQPPWTWCWPFQTLIPQAYSTDRPESSVVSVNERTPWPWMYENCWGYFTVSSTIICQSVSCRKTWCTITGCQKKNLYSLIIRCKFRKRRRTPDAEITIPVARFLSVTRDCPEEKALTRILRALRPADNFRYTGGRRTEKTALKNWPPELGPSKWGTLYRWFRRRRIPRSHHPTCFSWARIMKDFNVLIKPSLGIPVCGISSSGSIPEVVEHGINGLLVDGQAPEDLAVAIRSHMISRLTGKNKNGNAETLWCRNHCQGMGEPVPRPGFPPAQRVNNLNSRLNFPDICRHINRLTVYCRHETKTAHIHQFACNSAVRNAWFPTCCSTCRMIWDTPGALRKVRSITKYPGPVFDLKQSLDEGPFTVFLKIPMLSYRFEPVL